MTDLTFYLMDPFIFFSFAFILLTVFLWGRGASLRVALPVRIVSRTALQGLQAAVSPVDVEGPRLVAQQARLSQVCLLRPDPGRLVLRLLPFRIHGGGRAVQDVRREVEPGLDLCRLVRSRRRLFDAGLPLLLPVHLPARGMLALPARLTSIFPLVKLKRYDYCGTCRIGERSCDPQAIRRDGSIDAAECLYCLDCQVNYYNEALCPVLIRRAKGKDGSDLRSPNGIGEDAEIGVPVASTVSSPGGEDQGGGIDASACLSLTPHPDLPPQGGRGGRGVGPTYPPSDGDSLCLRSSCSLRCRPPARRSSSGRTLGRSAKP